MRRYLSPFGATSLLLLAFASTATARPVAPADFQGKKICWDSSLGKSVSVYGPGDKYASTTNGKGTWSLSSDLGLELNVDGPVPYQRYVEEKLPDGTFTSQLVYPTGLNLMSTGKYCK
jgi:hypothetical protein